ncbi:MAG: hypothetical protein WAX66_04055 [Patescibacteria group bacterium]
MKEERNQEAEESKLQPPYAKKFDNIKKLLRAAQYQLEHVANVIEMMEHEEKKTYYQSVPGTEGTFDGQYLVASDGRKTEVPGNYAAKSRLVCGDVLKVFADNGRQVFKQIDKVERKKIEGILTKKEGKWFILSDAGSYRILDVAAEFNQAELNDKVSAFIPANNSNSSFAALDRVFKENTNALKAKEGSHKVEVKVPSKVEKKIEERKPISKPKTFVKKKPLRAEKKEKFTEKDETSSKEYVATMVEEDDLR